STTTSRAAPMRKPFNSSCRSATPVSACSGRRRTPQPSNAERAEYPMNSIVGAPPVVAPDAGVIEEARQRQRRQRGAAIAAAVAAATVLLSVAFIAGGGAPR